MTHKRPPLPVIIIVLAVVGISAWFLYQQSLEAENGALTASGTIETVYVVISPELAGKVVSVSVEEGDAVQSGEELFRMDDTLLQAQYRAVAAALDSARAAALTAETALEAARVQVDLTVSAALAEARPARTLTWLQAGPSEFDQPAWYFSQVELLNAANVEVNAALAELETVMRKLAEARQDTAGEAFLRAEERLAAARMAFLSAQEIRDRASQSVASPELRDAAEVAYDSARVELENAQANYDDLLSSEFATRILEIRAELVVAQERYDSARDRLNALRTGDFSPRVAAAQKAAEQAEAAARQAQLAVTQAEANLALIDAQLDKLIVRAQVDGIIQNRNIQPGEVVAPGGAALTIARSGDLTITVYVPEDRYGAIQLGQQASLSVDSFPGETFLARVVHIADRAEFTPRNVQTVEGRKTTVYAIRLKLDDRSGKLKAGMPADVTFK